jgi:hypothetical protein
MEMVEGIPAHLLTAISLAETGRWDDDDRATFAWPWTVMAEGRGRYYPSKAVAVAAVKQLRNRGVKNIDVGCMQINLHYHGDAFASVEQAFDPTINIAYAAGFLHERFDAAGSWTEAAAAYHSTTPRHNQTYKIKVLKLWNEVRKREEAAPRAVASARAAAPDRSFFAHLATPADAAEDTVDHQRTRLLNKALEARRKGEKILDKAAVRMRQLDAWRSKQFADGGRHLSLMQRAEKRAERRLQRAGLRSRDERFAEKRRSQLEAWRNSLPVRPPVIEQVSDADS